jgi:NADPH2:quinone reductase
VAAGSDRETVLSLGASDVISRADGPTGAGVRKIVPSGADVLIDTASVAAPALEAIRDGGRYVTTTVAPGPVRDITVGRIYGVPDAPALAMLVGMAAAGTLHTPVAREFDVSEARAAYEEFGARPHYGRIVLTF